MRVNYLCPANKSGQTTGHPRQWRPSYSPLFQNAWSLKSLSLSGCHKTFFIKRNACSLQSAPMTVNTSHRIHRSTSPVFRLLVYYNYDLCVYSTANAVNLQLCLCFCNFKSQTLALYVATWLHTLNCNFSSCNCDLMIQSHCKKILLVLIFLSWNKSALWVILTLVCKCESV